MKKSLIIGLLATGSALASYGQGQIIFSNYGGTSSPTVQYSTVAANVPSGKAGLAIGNTFNVGLLYYVGTSSADVATSSSQMTAFSFATAPIFGKFSTFNAGDSSPSAQNGAGWFSGGQITIPGVTSGTATFVSFLLEAYNAPTFGGATVRGQSSIFKTPVWSGSGGVPSMAGAFGFAGSTHALFTVSDVAPVPEPSSLALAGLGGFGMLMAMRRKKA